MVGLLIVAPAFEPIDLDRVMNELMTCTPRNPIPIMNAQVFLQGLPATINAFQARKGWRFRHGARAGCHPDPA